jgi:endonuclease-3
VRINSNENLTEGRSFNRRGCDIIEERIIRTERELSNIRRYIKNKPASWPSDPKPMKPTTKTIRHLHTLLIAEYGEPEWHPRDPVASLVNTILSQNTNDVNRDRAFDQMRERLPTWEAVRDAPLGELIDAVRPAGLAPTKAPRIQEALRRITAERGEISLEFLADWGVEEARTWLLSIPGVGPKTAAIVLLFALGKPAFPVDTHIHRVTRRLGLIPDKISREKAHGLLESLVPPDLYYPLHLNIIEHGRAVCHARNPKHEQCVLREQCAFYANLGSADGA